MDAIQKEFFLIHAYFSLSMPALHVLTIKSTASFGESVKWINPRSSGLIIFSLSIVVVSHASMPRQYWEPKSTTGKLRILRVWINVNASKSSSIVPKPPGKMTYALLYLMNIVLRTKKYLNDSD